jgi:hypothetical protein
VPALVADGATEARQLGVMFGVESLRAAMGLVDSGAGAADVTAAVEAAVAGHTSGELTDDVGPVIRAI